MPRFKITVRQWLEQNAESEFDAPTQTEAWSMATQKADWEWADGTKTTNFEIASIEEVPAPEPAEEPEE